jgi:hypothetical protein
MDGEGRRTASIRLSSSIPRHVVQLLPLDLFRYLFDDPVLP